MKVKILATLKDIDRELWDSCLGTSNPFVSHDFLSVMEESKTACRATGWIPHHLQLLDEEDRTLSVAPAYLKTHSVGEFVFDYAWANAYQQAGGRYYPKLQVAVPYTPVPGPRVNRPELLQALVQITEQAGLSSAHITFCEPAEYKPDSEWLGRTGIQFHWHNRGYQTFADFLAALSARKRKAVKKERQEAQAAGLTFESLTGAELQERHWDAFYQFYMDTTSRKWGEAALTRSFFSMLGERMADRVVLFMVSREGRYVAGALNLQGPDCLYGRNWGCLEYHPCLHFELCYYQALDWAIARQFARVEAGAQGMHKVARGYEPVQTYSLHYIRDPGFRRVLDDYLRRETEAILQDQAEIQEHSPFRQAAPRGAEE